jgi:hypothetical protein
LALLVVGVVSTAARGTDPAPNAGAEADAGTKAEPGTEAQAEAQTEPAPGQNADPRTVLERYPKVTVSPRIPVLEDKGVYPCTDCHDGDMVENNPKERKLEDEHGELVLEHGGGRFWCLTCHHEEERDKLRSLKGEPIDYDDSHLLCGQCHFRSQRDFFFGAHGKRLDSWRGERKVLACTACHDAHSPSIKKRKPYRADRLREGLLPPYRPKGHKAFYERGAHD